MFPFLKKIEFERFNDLKKIFFEKH